MTMTTQPLLPAWRTALAEWRTAEAGREPATLTKNTKHLHHLARSIGEPDPYAVTAEALRTWVDSQPWAPTTATTYRASLRRFYGWAHATGRTPNNPAEYLTGRARRDSAPARPAPGPDPLPAPLPWREPLARWARDMRAIGRPQTTIDLRVRHLRRFARETDLQPFGVTFEDLVEWMAQHTEWSVETRRSFRSSFRVFYAWAAEAGYVAEDPAERLPATGVGTPSPRPASETAYKFALLTAGPREHLMIRLAAEMGLRRAEVARVHSRDVIEQDGGWSLLVHGKGQRQRLVPLPDSLAALLRDLPPGYAFPSPSGGHLTPAHVGKVVARCLPEGVSMHALRHRFATRAYGIAHDVFAVQQLLGHSSPNTTRRYVAVGDERLRATVTALQSNVLTPALEVAQ